MSKTPQSAAPLAAINGRVTESKKAMWSFRLSAPAASRKYALLMALVLAAFAASFAIERHTGAVIRMDAGIVPPPVFRDRQEPGQWRAASLIGVGVFDVVGRRVGAVKDVLMRQDGRIQTVVINVEGFMGFGGRTIAVAFDDIRWQSDDRQSPAPSSNVAGAEKAPARPIQGRPDKAFIGMTVALLQSAPEFHYAAADAAVPDFASLANEPADDAPTH